LAVERQEEMNKRSSSSRPWKAATLAVVQLILMGCIVLGLFSCFVGWQVVRQDISLTDLLPRIDQGERTARNRRTPATPTPPTDERGKTEGQQPAAPPPPAATPPAQGAPPPAAAGAPTPAVLVVAAPVPTPSTAHAPRGLLAHLPTRAATRLVIPSLGVDAPVVLIPVRDGTWDVGQITQEVGHLQGTASPGESSNAVLAGHITLEQGGYGPFKSLAQLKVGETTVVYAGDEQYTYIIRSVDIVAPDNVEVTYPTSEPILTLITCANWDKAARRYKDRVVAVGYLAQ
jgi:LPXTG-site transpeptidase (sortase) family protein